MESNFKISIIVPFYNRIDLLNETILSVLQQESDDWELILVDDGSDESTTELIKRYQSEKIRFFKRERNPKGAPTCRNIGAERANFDHILFLDSDDLLAPWAIKKRIKILKNNQNYNLYVFEGLEFDNKTGEHRLRTIHKTEKPLELFLDFQSVWQTSCSVWKKNIFWEIGGWNENVESWQDGEIHIRYLNKYTELKWGSSFPDVFIRKHHDQNRISNQKGIEKIDNLYDTYQTTLALITDKDLKRNFEVNIENSLFTFPEGDVDYNAYILWLKKRFEGKQFLKWLILYINLYKITPKGNFFKRVLYQLRKIGIPNKRKKFWSLRPKLSEVKLKRLKNEITKNELLKKEVKLL